MGLTQQDPQVKCVVLIDSSMSTASVVTETERCGAEILRAAFVIADHQPPATR
jgi:hypothetical protein